MKYTVKQLADKMEISEHTLRYYTDMGLLPCGRDKNNRRVFDQESVNWVEGIKCLRSCGMSIEAIKEYSDLCMEKETEERLRARETIFLQQQKVAHQRLAQAQATADYIDNKVEHYRAVLAGETANDTNPNNWDAAPKKGC
ncbi:MerR family transcriptional regulator [Eisenbergiella tayi]|uniref:MerR family transcriptional regulator n=1 Tax=Eisenbergiella tayi TaxID=1432052 RepID=UPI0022E455FA|nr:MerR family transcriptional regulator [Eisenbergiella tayi]